jgi:hypothetical protein
VGKNKRGSGVVDTAPEGERERIGEREHERGNER